MDAQIVSGLIAGGTTLVAAAIGFGAVVWQIGRQGGLARESAKQGQQREFKNQLFHEGVSAAHSMSGAASDFSSYLAKVKMQLTIAQISAAQGQNFVCPDVRFAEIMNLYSEFARAQLDFIFLVEQRQIIDPRILIFRDTLSAKMFEFGKRYPREFTAALMPRLPMESATGELFPYSPPDQAALEEISREIDIASDAMLDCICCATDFIVEMQNVLLGEIFEHEVPHRDAPDPTKQAIRLDDIEEIQACIERSPWGIECAQVEGDARRRFAHNATADVPAKLR